MCPGAGYGLGIGAGWGLGLDADSGLTLEGGGWRSGAEEMGHLCRVRAARAQVYFAVLQLSKYSEVLRVTQSVASQTGHLPGSLEASSLALTEDGTSPASQLHKHLPWWPVLKTVPARAAPGGGSPWGR